MGREIEATQNCTIKKTSLRGFRLSQTGHSITKEKSKMNWAVGAAEKIGQQINFWKNISMAGGMLMVFAHGPGRSA